MLRQRGGNSEKDVARDSLISRYLSDVGSNTSAPASLRAHSFYNLGKLAYDRQDYANSVNYFKQSLKIDPQRRPSAQKPENGAEETATKPAESRQEQE